MLYVLFGLIGAVTSFVVTIPGPWTTPGGVSVLVYVVILVRIHILDIKLPRAVDISLDRVVCSAGEAITIVAVNLDKKEQSVESPMLRIRKVANRHGTEAVAAEAIADFGLPETPGIDPTMLRPRQAFTWRWLTPARGGGVYSIEIELGKGTHTLRRMIRVTPKPSAAAAAADGRTERGAGQQGEQPK
jgi:hypothetical protein